MPGQNGRNGDNGHNGAKGDRGEKGETGTPGVTTMLHMNWKQCTETKGTDTSNGMLLVRPDLAIVRLQLMIRFNLYDVVFRNVPLKNIVAIRHYMWNLEELYEQVTKDPDRAPTDILDILFVFDGSLHLMDMNAIHPLMVSCLRVREAIHIVHTKSAAFVKRQRIHAPSG